MTTYNLKQSTMLCKNFSELSHYERIKFIGELVHACQVHNAFFNTGKKIIEVAKEKGVFERAVILPEKIEQYETISQ